MSDQTDMVHSAHAEAGGSTPMFGQWNFQEVARSLWLLWGPAVRATNQCDSVEPLLGVVDHSRARHWTPRTPSSQRARGLPARGANAPSDRVTDL